MSFPTPALTDLSLSSQGIKGLCWDADVPAVTGICHTSSPLMGPLHCHEGDKTVIYQFCRFFGLGCGLGSLHNENTVTAPKDSDFGEPSVSFCGPGLASEHLVHETKIWGLGSELRFISMVGRTTHVLPRSIHIPDQYIPQIYTCLFWPWKFFPCFEGV